MYIKDTKELGKDILRTKAASAASDVEEVVEVVHVAHGSLNAIVSILSRDMSVSIFDD
jgi:hypothetical protein